MHSVVSLPSAVLIVLLGATAVSEAAEARVAISGTRLSCQPARGFEKAEGFAGFENIERQISFLVTEIPLPEQRPASQVLSFFEGAFSAEAMRSQGLILQSSERTKVAGTEALLIRCTQTAKGVDHTKWALLIPDGGSKIAQVQIAGPKANFKMTEDAIVGMINSLKWEGQTAEVQTFYTIQLPEGWRLAKQLATIEMYSETGSFPVKKGEATLSVYPLGEAVPEKQRDGYVRTKNLKRNYYEQLQELESFPTVIDGFPAYISFVSSISTQDSSPVTLQYCYVFLPTATVLIESRRHSAMSRDTFVKTAMTWKVKRVKPVE